MGYKAYAVTAVTKMGGLAYWRYDSLSANAGEAKREAEAYWYKYPRNHWGDEHPDGHLFRVSAKPLDKGEFPVCLGRWVKTGELKDGKWIDYGLPEMEE